ncbi:MAG: hypothetical protein QM647_16140 [Asticcacaulis sp.]|uniref:hypothetical protein n=1 Tax=Asticcacaulis sp. TaxID=1872648 RepID=UPI0039E66138
MALGLAPVTAPAQSSAAVKGAAASQTTPPQRAKALIDWVAAAARHRRSQTAQTVQALLARLPKPELNKPRLPILLPRDGGPISTLKARMVAFGDAYSLNLPQANGTQVTISGTSSFETVKAGVLSRAKLFRTIENMSEPVSIQQTEDGWTATFTRFNVSYTVDVNCDSPDSADCKTDAFLRKAVAAVQEVYLGEAALAEARAAGARP